MLYHLKVGLICTTSLAKYKILESNNQQPQPGEDIALTPRLETYKGGIWYTNLYDLEATFTTKDKVNSIDYKAKVQLKDENKKIVTDTASDFELNYKCTAEMIEITAKTHQDLKEDTTFVLPVVSQTGEKVIQISENEITIEKPEGTVKVTASNGLKIKEISKSRTFNMVPGVEAVPIITEFPKEQKEVKINIEVI
jgi:hypothetical protein